MVARATSLESALHQRRLPRRATSPTHPPRGPQKVAVAKIGRANYTTMEDLPEGEQAFADTFSLNGHPTTVLFDS
jgi:hypothetical protein